MFGHDGRASLLVPALLLVEICLDWKFRRNQIKQSLFCVIAIPLQMIATSNNLRSFEESTWSKATNMEVIHPSLFHFIDSITKVEKKGGKRREWKIERHPTARNSANIARVATQFAACLLQH